MNFEEQIAETRAWAISVIADYEPDSPEAFFAESVLRAYKTYWIQKKDNETYEKCSKL